MKAKTLTLALLLIGFVAFPTFAIDCKIYPGSMGVRWNASDPVPALNHSVLNNPHATRWLRVDLPIVRDVTTRTFRSGWVKAIDTHPTRDVWSRMVSVYRTPCRFASWQSPWRKTTGVSGCAKTLFFGGLGTNAISHAYFSTWIPDANGRNLSGVVSYQVCEN